MKDRQRWQAEEDAVLEAYVKQHGPHDWNSISERMGKTLDRDAKSCLERWRNYLKPGIKKGPLSEEEQKLVISLQAKYGNKWKKIAAEMPGRTAKRLGKWWEVYKEKQHKEWQKEQQLHFGAVSAVADGDVTTAPNLPPFPICLPLPLLPPAPVVSAAAALSSSSATGNSQPISTWLQSARALVSAPDSLLKRMATSELAQLHQVAEKKARSDSQAEEEGQEQGQSSLPVWMSKATTFDFLSPSEAKGGESESQFTVRTGSSTIDLTLATADPACKASSSCETAPNWLQHGGVQEGNGDTANRLHAAWNQSGNPAAVDTPLADLLKVCADLEEGRQQWVNQRKELVWKLRRLEEQLQAEKAQKGKQKAEELEAKLEALREEKIKYLDTLEADYNEQIAELHREADLKEAQLLDLWAAKQQQLTRAVDQLLLTGSQKAAFNGGRLL